MNDHYCRWTGAPGETEHFCMQKKNECFVGCVVSLKQLISLAAHCVHCYVPTVYNSIKNYGTARYIYWSRVVKTIL